MVSSLYASADMEEDLSITLQPVDGFQHVRGHIDAMLSLVMQNNANQILLVKI